MLSALLAAAALGAAAQAWAHHSSAMFDHTQEIELEGTVKEFQWTNPHVWIQLLVEQGGKQVEYSIEGASPNGLVRKGWSRTSFKAGDRIKVKVNPLKDGAPGGAFLSATTQDGKVLTPQGAG
jgi:hypothetical protein